MTPKNKQRCAWVNDDPLYIHYHDEEWGRAIYDSHKLLEFLILEGMQAGLSWITILKKRENFREAFDNFDPEKIAKYKQSKIDKLLKNPGIIRNKLKINAAVTNAQLFLEIGKDNFSEYLWQFVDGKPIKNHWKTINQVPITTKESDNMSKTLKKRGFKFVGSTICYAFMQAVGMVNDHTMDCFCRIK